MPAHCAVASLCVSTSLCTSIFLRLSTTPDHLRLCAFLYLRVSSSRHLYCSASFLSLRLFASLSLCAPLSLYILTSFTVSFPFSLCSHCTLRCSSSSTETIFSPFFFHLTCLVLWRASSRCSILKRLTLGRLPYFTFGALALGPIGHTVN